MLSRHRRSPKNLTLNDIYYDWLNDMGVISSITDAPWYSSVDLSSLDIAYHGVRSGLKFASPVLYNFIDEDTGRITMYTYGVVGRMLWAKYRLKWSHLWTLYQSQYNPLHSYNITESVHKETEYDSEVSDSRSIDDTITKSFPKRTLSTLTSSSTSSDEDTTLPTKTTTKAETRTPALTERTVVNDKSETNVEGTDDLTHGRQVATSESNSSTSQENTFGFNTTATDGVPQSRTSNSETNSSTETNSGTDARATTEDTTTTRDTETTLTKTGTETTSGTDTEAYTGVKNVSLEATESATDTTTEQYDGSETTAKDISDESTREGHDVGEETTTSTKTGNIFKSPAELLTADREFWLTEFFSIVFDDIDNMLTLSIYSESEVYHKIF